MSSYDRFCIKALTVLLFCFACSFSAAAQDRLTQARLLVSQQKFTEAITIFKGLYEEMPADNEVYTDYLSALVSAKHFKEAEQLAKHQLDIMQQHPAALVSLGNVYAASGKEKKAAEEWSKAVEFINGDDMLTQQLAASFTASGNDIYAIKVYERAIELTRSPYLYANALSRLYGKTGNTEKAVSMLLDAAPAQMNGVEDIKSALLELLNNEPARFVMAQKAVVKKINLQPDNPYFEEILTWIYTQKDDWEGALIQIEALDERNKEDGQRLLEFARFAVKEGKYEIAAKALQTVVDKGSGRPLYAVALSEKLSAEWQRLQANYAWTPQDAAALEKEYAAFFNAFPQYTITQPMRDYAQLIAQYSHRPADAIRMLQDAISAPGASRDFIGNAKLQLGDYQMLTGDVWEASLTYSQVDKDFKQDMLGEEARYRNAKLSYYRGDFEWAQGQLSVLKASTSELIANDALYLSVLITENISKDSNMVPLRRFAYADLLLFQHKDKEAETLLDSITTAFPEHALNDDILLLKSKLAEHRRDYTAALSHLKKITDKYSDDVLGDDALYRSATIYDHYLNDPQKAKTFYEDLILQFPGSTYVQVARLRLSAIDKPAGT